MDVRFIGDWVIDFQLRTAYRRLKSGGYLNRQRNGDVIYMPEPPAYILKVVAEYEAVLNTRKKNRRTGALAG